MKVESAPVTFSFDGAARNADALGLQGALELDVPSIRELAAWTGNPLDLPGEGLGPFNVAGQLEMTGAKVALTEAKLKLDEINGDGQFSIDATGAKPMIKAELTVDQPNLRSEEHTSELQSLMRISYAVFCLKKKNNHKPT